MLRRHSTWAGLVCGLAAAAVGGAPAIDREASPGPGLLIALSSFRDRPLHPRVYFYEHDGRASGRPVGAIDPVDLRVETRPTFALGGRLVACAAEVENNAGFTLLWDLEAKRLLDAPPGLNTGAAEIGAAISADGGWVAFCAWSREGGPSGFGLYLYDLREKKAVDLPVNVHDDERSPTLSGDGRLLAFVSNRPGGEGSSDIYLYDRSDGRLRSLPGLNSPFRETDPSLSADGRFLAFTSDRTGGVGPLDVYLYDLAAGRLVPLPGLNGPGLDQTPALSPDGRFIAFVAERVSGEGERDVYLYDREHGRLLPTPGLNSRAEDFDPALTYRSNSR
jgi:dipeptidyl aminopeptidase/acylaminoacyl peptidase